MPHPPEMSLIPIDGKLGGNDEWQAALREELAELKKQLQALSSNQVDMTKSLLYAVADLKGFLGPQSPRTTDVFLPVEVVQSPENLEDVTPGQVMPDFSPQKTTPRGKSQKAHLHREASMVKKKEASKDRLERMIEIDTSVRKQEQEDEERYKKAGCVDRFKMLQPTNQELILDSTVLFFIVLNAIFIGISADNWDGSDPSSIYCVIDVVFTGIFLAELFIKLTIHGCHKHWTGDDKAINIFDAILVTVDTVQLIFIFFAAELNNDMKKAGVPSASLFRIVRVIRITRVLRILRHRAFEELLAMMEGTISGITTLGWAIVVFGVVVYVMALLCREFFGEQAEHDNVYLYFNDVPRAMFTVFRCAFGDCSTDGGTPIPEFIMKSYGTFYSGLYSLFVFFISIGLFNVISAIFVGSVMKNGEERDLRKLQERFADERLWATRVSTIVKQCLWKTGHLKSPTDAIDKSMLDAEIPREVLEYMCMKDPDTIEALDDLDIDPFDHRKLADILDPDHSGGIALLELVTGLHRLRGAPRRSDIVTIDLMVRSVQDMLDHVLHELSQVHNFVITSQQAPQGSPIGSRIRYHV